jgi:hypothetical protein
MHTPVNRELLGTNPSPASQTAFFPERMSDRMSKVTYKVVRHDGGWAYQVNETFSETFTTREIARKAARLAAAEQLGPGESTPISYEDQQGKWHSEIAPGDDRPTAIVES